MAGGRLIVAIDGGGTRTRCTAVDVTGHFVADGESGPLMGLHSGQRAAERALRQALGRCLGALTARSRVERVGISVPLGDRQRLAALVRSRITGARIHWVEGEGLACLAAATDARRGLVVLSGTGSFADAVDGDAVVGHAGGFGPLLGDDGSAYAIGLAGLRAAVRAYQGRADPTGLLDAACHHFDVADLWGLVGRLYGSRLPRQQIAGFAPAVISLAADGDAGASRIVRQAADELADMARAAVAQAGWAKQAFPTVLCGGVLDGSRKLQAMLRRRLRNVAPRARPIPSRFAPAVGVALLTMGRRRGAAPATIANLEATLPPAYKTGR